MDYDNKVSPEKCLANVLDNIEPGSIIVFHDSLKAKANLKVVLPQVLQYIKDKGWPMLPIKQNLEHDQVVA